jgi:hypothetical protein
MIVSKTAPPKIVKLPTAKQRRMDQLLEKNSEGTITPRETALLERLVGEAERLMVANARRLAKFAETEQTHAPANAVPVTVWVTPDHAG